MPITECWTIAMVTPVFKPKPTRPASEKQVISPPHNLGSFHSSSLSSTSTSPSPTITMFTSVPSFADYEIILPCKEDGGLAPFHRERLSPAMDMAYRFLRLLQFLISPVVVSMEAFIPISIYPPKSILSTFSW